LHLRPLALQPQALQALAESLGGDQRERHRDGGGRSRLSLPINGCVCGYQGDPTHDCTCSAVQIQRYRARISGPLLDRIDIQVEVPAVRYKELADHTASETSAAIRARVARARAI